MSASRVRLRGPGLTVVGVRARGVCLAVRLRAGQGTLLLYYISYRFWVHFLRGERGAGP